MIYLQSRLDVEIPQVLVPALAMLRQVRGVRASDQLVAHLALGHPGPIVVHEVGLRKEFPAAGGDLTAEANRDSRAILNLLNLGFFPFSGIAWTFLAGAGRRTATTRSRCRTSGFDSPGCGCCLLSLLIL